MKKFLLIVSAFAGISLSLSSCIKEADHFTDFQDVDPIVELKTGVSAGGGADLVNIAGLANFGNAALSSIPNFFADTVSWYVNLGSEYTLDKAVTVTIGIQPELIAAYNSDTTHLQYELMPDSDYVWNGDVTVTIPAGQRTAVVTGLQFNYDLIDPSKNYMLPIGIKSADGGVVVSGNQGAIYFHAIGNPLAGTYLQSFYRWNDIDTTEPPNSTVFEDEPTPVAAANPTTLIFPEYYLEVFTATGYAFSFNSSLTSFSVDLEDADAVAAGGFSVAAAPTLVSANVVGDASTGYAGTTFEFYAEFVNSSGGHRKVIDIFTKQ